MNNIIKPGKLPEMLQKQLYKEFTNNFRSWLIHEVANKNCRTLHDGVSHAIRENLLKRSKVYERKTKNN